MLQASAYVLSFTRDLRILGKKDRWDFFLVGVGFIQWFFQFASLLSVSVYLLFSSKKHQQNVWFNCCLWQSLGVFVDSQALCTLVCLCVCFFIILSLITVSSGVRAWITFDKHIHYIINKHSLHIHTTTDDGQIRSENEKAITIVVESELL